MYQDKEVRALSWKQPFLFLMDPRFGKIETRTWSTKYRGLVLMCASKTPYSERQVMEISGQYQFERIMNRVADHHDLIKYGMATHIGELVDCRPMKPEDMNMTFTRFDESLFCHVYENVKPIIPIHWKGQQGWKILKKAEKNLIALDPQFYA